MFLGKEGDFLPHRWWMGHFRDIQRQWWITKFGPAIPEQVGRGKPYLNVRKRCRARLFPHCYRVPQTVPGPPRALRVLARFFIILFSFLRGCKWI